MHFLTAVFTLNRIILILIILGAKFKHLWFSYNAATTFGNIYCIAVVLTGLDGLGLDDESSWMQRLCPLSKSHGVDVEVVRGILKAEGGSLLVTPGNDVKAEQLLSFDLDFSVNLFFHIFTLDIISDLIPHSGSGSTKRQHITQCCSYSTRMRWKHSTV